MNEMLSGLKISSDIRGIAIQHENNDITLSEKSVDLISKGYAKYIKEILEKKPKDIKIGVGNDPRITGDKLKNIFINNLLNEGFEVIDFGLATTPSMFMSTIFPKYNCDASIIFTASHLPFFYNGIKFFTKQGGFEKTDVTKVIEYASLDKKNDASNEKGKLTKESILDEYSKFLREFIIKGIDSKNNNEKPLTGLHIVVDAGNGSGGFFAKEVLEKLGADISGSLFLDPDGMFPNHIPNPENKEAIGYLKRAVVENKADLGIIFDTDVDRSSCVDKYGEEISRNKLVALASAITLENYPNSYIVTDSITSNELADFITNLGGKHYRYQRGYKNVINKAIELNAEGKECHLAIETSGHAAFKENHFLDDGAYLVALIIIKFAKLRNENKDIENLLANYKDSVEDKEIRLKTKTPNTKEILNKIIIDIKKNISENDNWTEVIPNYEGIRINVKSSDGEGWFLLRASLHEPLLCINVESNYKSGTEKISSELLNIIKKYDDVEI